MEDATQPDVADSNQSAREADGTPIDLTGKTLGDFQLLRRLGEGGMGQVYLAEQLSLKRKVALKLLRADLAANPTALQRFKIEAEAVARATHANIVQVYAIGLADGLHYMALEYVEGRNLREYVEKKGPPEVMVALSIIRQVASALQRASELGIIHRDIKPENILLTRKNEVKVADFGLSRVFGDAQRPVSLTQSGVTMGTPLYMSPEQVEGRPMDPRTDIYSFGATCYHMLAGHPPFRGQTAFEVAAQHVQKQPVPLQDIRPDLPPELCALVHTMMAKRPEDRYQTGREIVKEVARLRDVLVGVTGGQVSTMLGMGPTPSGPSDVTLTQSVPRLRSRRWPGVLFVGSLLLALAGGLGIGWFYNRQQPPETAPVEIVLPKTAEQEQKKREEYLFKVFHERAAPEAQRDVRRGLEAAADLALFYLKDRRWTEADQFFQELSTPEQKIKPYQHFGLVGHAVVLAFKDRADESNKLFVRMLTERTGDKGMMGGKVFWTVQPKLRELVARALNHNHANAPAAFPPVLEPFRHPPAAVIKATGQTP